MAKTKARTKTKTKKKRGPSNKGTDARRVRAILAGLDRVYPDATCARVDKNVFARLQSRNVFQGVPRGHKGYRQRDRLLE